MPTRYEEEIIFQFLKVVILRMSWPHKFSVISLPANGNTPFKKSSTTIHQVYEMTISTANENRKCHRNVSLAVTTQKIYCDREQKHFIIFSHSRAKAPYLPVVQCCSKTFLS